jgi:hypothetical protein
MSPDSSRDDARVEINKILREKGFGDEHLISGHEDVEESLKRVEKLLKGD